MRLTTATFVAAGLVAGLGGASFAFQSATDEPVAVAAAAPGPTARPTQIVVRLLDCRAGWTLKHEICVRVVEHRVVVPAARGAAASEPAPVAQRRNTPPAKPQASKPGSVSSGHQHHGASSAGGSGGSTSGSGGESEDHAEHEDPAEHENPEDGPEVDDD